MYTASQTEKVQDKLSDHSATNSKDETNINLLFFLFMSSTTSLLQNLISLTKQNQKPSHGKVLLRILYQERTANTQKLTRNSNLN